MDFQKLIALKNHFGFDFLARGEVVTYVGDDGEEHPIRPDMQDYLLTAAKDILLRQADQIAKSKRDAVVVDISPSEMASWPIKRAEALAYQASGLDADAPSLAVEADARDISLAELVAKVLAKAAPLSYIEAGIAGYCGKLQDQIRNAESDADLDAIDLHAGWPKVYGE